jgi:hypothetical protein
MKILNHDVVDLFDVFVDRTLGPLLVLNVIAAAVLLLLVIVLLVVRP